MILRESQVKCLLTSRFRSPRPSLLLPQSPHFCAFAVQLCIVTIHWRSSPPSHPHERLPSYTKELYGGGNARRAYNWPSSVPRQGQGLWSKTQEIRSQEATKP